MNQPRQPRPRINDTDILEIKNIIADANNDITIDELAKKCDRTENSVYHIVRTHLKLNLKWRRDKFKKPAKKVAILTNDDDNKRIAGKEYWGDSSDDTYFGAMNRFEGNEL